MNFSFDLCLVTLNIVLTTYIHDFGWFTFFFFSSEKQVSQVLGIFIERKARVTISSNNLICKIYRLSLT